MKISQVAAQLYTVRDFLKTPADIKSSLKKVRKIGYEAVQLSGLGPIKDAELRKILDGEGLVACSTHEPSDELLDHPEKSAERLVALNCPGTAYPYPRGINFGTIAGVRSLIKKLNHAGEVLHGAKKIFAYHNHNIEFMRIKDKAIMEIIYEETDPRFVQGEIDTYWVQAGGGDPVDWCRRLKKRLPYLHLKDYGVDAERTAVFKEIGYGNLDWPSIISAAEKSGCKWFIIEQDANWLKGDPFKSLKASFDYIAANLVAK